MRYFISAGEASGDLHASHLITALKEHDPDAQFRFLGGDLMAAAGGVAPVVHYRQMAFMGFVDVLKNLRTVLGNLDSAKKSMAEFSPDALILVDYPSFNLRLAEYAAKRGIPVYYYISPKVWAWKEHRVKAIRRLVKRLFSILPFEVEYFRRHGYEVTYVGNPSKNEVDRKLAAMGGEQEFRLRYSLGGRPLIALVPGSRVSEIRKNLPMMLAAVAGLDDYQPVIAAAPSIAPELYERLAPGVKRCDDTLTLEYFSVAALVTSGTATLEAALTGTPQVVTYRAVGSRLVYNLFKHILKVKYVSLPNLIMDSPIVTELLLHQCTPENIRRELTALLPGGARRQRQLDDYARLHSVLGENDAAATTAAQIVNDLQGN